MPEFNLQLAVDQYKLEPNSSNAIDLCHNLFRYANIPTSPECFKQGFNSRYSQGCLILSLDNRHIVISHFGNQPIACEENGIVYILDLSARRAIAAREDISVSTLSRQINYIQNEPKFLVARTINQISELELYSKCVEKYKCRLQKLFNYWLKNSDNLIAAGLTADTYLQSLEFKSTNPISAIWEWYKQIYVELETFYILLSESRELFTHHRPIAAINRQTKQCFHIPSKNPTTLKQISTFLKHYNVVEHKKGSNIKRFQCIPVSTKILEAIFN